MAFYAPKDDDTPADSQPQVADSVFDVIAALPERTVTSMRKLRAELRKAGHQYRNTVIRDAVDDLVVDGRLVEIRGPRGATGYSAVLTGSEEEPQ